MMKTGATKAPARILVVEDERDIAALIAYHLAKEGYRVRTAEDGNEALQAVSAERPDLIVLDLMLPGFSGDEVLTELRRRPELIDVPVVILTARREESDRIAGLELGADDYLTKPFSPRELVLRVQAILRRTSGSEDGYTRARTASFGDGQLVLDESRREAVVRGDQVELTPTEWAVLVVLSRAPGRVFTRFELVNRTRGYDFEGYERTVDSHVKNLRRKIEADPH